MSERSEGVSGRRKSKQIVARVEGKHVKDCGAMRAVANGTWPSPWCALHPKGTDGLVWRNKNGAGSRGSYLWVRFICNHVGCPATVLIRGDAIVALAPHGEARRRKEASHV